MLKTSIATILIFFSLSSFAAGEIQYLSFNPQSAPCQQEVINAYLGKIDSFNHYQNNLNIVIDQIIEAETNDSHTYLVTSFESEKFKALVITNENCKIINVINLGFTR